MSTVVCHDCLLGDDVGSAFAAGYDWERYLCGPCSRGEFPAWMRCPGEECEACHALGGCVVGPDSREA
jgi:hypothetical protein